MEYKNPRFIYASIAGAAMLSTVLLIALIALIAFASVKTLGKEVQCSLSQSNVHYPCPVAPPRGPRGTQPCWEAKFSSDSELENLSDCCNWNGGEDVVNNVTGSFFCRGRTVPPPSFPN